MNKKIYLILICALIFCSSHVFALEWGVFRDYKQRENFSVSKLISNTPIKYYLTEADNLFDYDEKPTNDTEALKNQIGSSLEQKNRMKEYETMISSAFNNWVQETKRIIREEKRTSEFKDILNLLPDRVKLIKVNNLGEEDIIIKFSHKRPIDPDSGSYTISTHKLVLPSHFLPDEKSFKKRYAYSEAILIHEIGHFWGLVDQYKEMRNSDLEHSTADRFSGTSVMAASYTKELYCDDVDGFINLIDLTYSIKHNGEFPDKIRNEKGWASFCNGKKKYEGTEDSYKNTFYKKAKILNKPDYFAKICTYYYDEEGNIDEVICPTPFNFYQKETLYNGYNLISKTKDGYFECSYYYSNVDEDKIDVDCITYGANDLLTSQKKEINNKQVWSINSAYEINEFNKEGYVYLKDNICEINNYIPQNDYKAYNLTFTNNNLDTKYSYIFLIKGIRAIPLVAQKDAGSCSIKLCDKKALPARKNCKDIFADERAFNKVLDYTALSYEQVKNQTDKICREKLSLEKINNAKELCKYFKTADEFFKTLKENNQIIGGLPNPKKLKRKKD